MKTIEFSVIIPVFNRAVKLVRSVESVRRAASYSDSTVEIVVVDDASTDGSANAAAAAGVDTVITQRVNAGVTCARNAGIEIAKGEVLILLDSDDELKVEALATIGVHFIRYPATDVLFGACEDRAGRLMHDSAAKFGRMNFRDLLVLGARGEFLPVVRRRVFESVRFEGKLRGFEGITWLKVARGGFDLHYTSDVLRVYDNEGVDRLCHRPNIVRGADRLALGWGFFLDEFGLDLWTFSKLSYLKVATRWAVYARIQARSSQKSGPELPKVSGASRMVLSAIRSLCAVIPCSIWTRYISSR